MFILYNEALNVNSVQKKQKIVKSLLWVFRCFTLWLKIYVGSSEFLF